VHGDWQTYLASTVTAAAGTCAGGGNFARSI
jgi:hypothetical protein